MANRIPHSIFVMGPFEAQLSAAAKGFAAELTAGKIYRMGGRARTRAQIVNDLAAFVARYSEPRLAAIELRKLLNARDAAQPAARAYLNDLKSLAFALVGADSPKLADFGFVPHRRPKLTTAQYQRRAAKSLETRLANRTLGKQQKKRVAAGEPLSKVVGSTSKSGPKR